MRDLIKLMLVSIGIVTGTGFLIRWVALMAAGEPFLDAVILSGMMVWVVFIVLVNLSEDRA